MHEDRDCVTERIVAERPFLRRLASRYARQSADAEDLVQETILRAYRARGRFVRGSSVRSWLATILVHASYNAAARRRRRATCLASDMTRSPAEPADRSAPPAAAGWDDFESVEDDLDEGLRAALLALSRRQRTPFCRHVLGGLTHGALAREMGIPAGTVMSLVFRARERLRRLLPGGFAVQRRPPGARPPPAAGAPP